MGWNLYALGDLTGTAEKAQMLGWSRKPFQQWFDHPLFSVNGIVDAAVNVKLLIATFWRGELVVWQGKNDAPVVADWFYTISSVSFITAGIAKLWTTRKNAFTLTSLMRSSFPLLLIMYLCFLMVLSIQFDFGSCQTPSRANPFFNKGRLILGGLVPFLILYIDGLCHLLTKIKLKINPLFAIGALCLILLLFSTIAASRVFGSAWNWFHAF